MADQPHAQSERLKKLMDEENKKPSQWSNDCILSHIRTIDRDGKEKLGGKK
jgi:hypothetical protein